MLLLLIACTPSGPTDMELHHEALQALDADPARSATLCAQIGDPPLRSECTWAAAEELVSTQPEAALALCATLPEEGAEECHFRLAEALNDATLCARAGAHADDCRMHVLSRGFATWVPRDANPGEIEDAALAPIAAAGLAPDDPRPWSALYRWVLGAKRPLDRGLCARVADPMRQEACLNTAIALFNDQLSHLRDRGVALCEGPLPTAATYAPDPELDAVLARRRAEDLCDPTARRAPPPEGLPGSGR